MACPVVVHRPRRPGLTIVWTNRSSGRPPRWCHVGAWPSAVRKLTTQSNSTPVPIQGRECEFRVRSVPSSRRSSHSAEASRLGGHFSRPRERGLTAPSTGHAQSPGASALSQSFGGASLQLAERDQPVMLVGFPLKRIGPVPFLPRQPQPERTSQVGGDEHRPPAFVLSHMNPLMFTHEIEPRGRTPHDHVPQRHRHGVDRHLFE